MPVCASLKLCVSLVCLCGDCCGVGAGWAWPWACSWGARAHERHDISLEHLDQNHHDQSD